MNSFQKEQVLALRKSGETFTNIADTLGLSVNTVKSFYRRHNAKEEIENNTVNIAGQSDACPQCGSKIIQIKGRKLKRFCTDECRVKWWNAHSESVEQKALYSFVCAHCDKCFTAYGNSKRKYCSHSCYCDSRFGRSPADRKAVSV